MISQKATPRGKSLRFCELRVRRDEQRTAHNSRLWDNRGSISMSSLELVRAILNRAVASRV